jgi:alcohol dehydrogenase (NADP+)
MHFELCMLIVLSAFVGAALGIDQQEPLTSNDLPSRGIPLLGFGTWNLNISPQNTTDAVSLAIQSGYRHIDGAAAYGNEKDVGRGIKEGLYSSNLTRNDIWVTSKLWNDQ